VGSNTLPCLCHHPAAHAQKLLLKAGLLFFPELCVAGGYGKMRKFILYNGPKRTEMAGSIVKMQKNSTILYENEHKILDKYDELGG
jgi:hypothetical protein